MLEIEADEGSDNEDNDDHVHRLDENDEENDERGLDEELAELIDNEFGELDED